MKTDPALWARIEGLAFDALDAAFPFSARLARDNGWTHEFAEAVIAEYKRFAYLARVTGREVTPSDEVDQAWHLHLTYTRHYWGPFREMLGAPFHHGPTAGGPAERRRYAENYAATLEAYAREFGAPPPADIWPPAERRFGDAAHFRRLNTRRYWLVQKPRRWPARKAAALAAGLGAAFSAVALARAETPGAEDLIAEYLDDVFVWLLLGILFLALIGRVFAGRGRRRNRNDVHDGGCGTGGCGTGGKSGNDSGSDGGGGGCGGGCGG